LGLSKKRVSLSQQCYLWGVLAKRRRERWLRHRKTLRQTDPLTRQRAVGEKLRGTQRGTTSKRTRKVPTLGGQQVRHGVIVPSLIKQAQDEGGFFKYAISVGEGTNAEDGRGGDTDQHHHPRFLILTLTPIARVVPAGRIFLV